MTGTELPLPPTNTTNNDDDPSTTTIKKLVAFQRLDIRGKQTPPPHCISLPAGRNMDTYDGHSYYYEPIRLDVAGKKAKKRNQEMIQIMEDHADYLLQIMDDTGTNFVSIEWVGTKFNKTPGVAHDVAMILHQDQLCDESMERSYEGIKSYLLGYNAWSGHPPVEGLVIEHNGVYWKLRADCFDRKCPFKTHPAAARAPVNILARRNNNETEI